MVVPGPSIAMGTSSVSCSEFGRLLQEALLAAVHLQKGLETMKEGKVVAASPLKVRRTLLFAVEPERCVEYGLFISEFTDHKPYPFPPDYSAPFAGPLPHPKSKKSTRSPSRHAAYDLFRSVDLASSGPDAMPQVGQAAGLQEQNDSENKLNDRGNAVSPEVLTHPA